jgi:hypothetical protein
MEPFSRKKSNLTFIKQNVYLFSLIFLTIVFLLGINMQPCNFFSNIYFHTGSVHKPDLTEIGVILPVVISMS